ncbi:HTH CENPB-type domain-containing protein [Trichonephila clavipes]|nr:HTH CENPB-type domain-containing protein [Trichonephila clavipes]
MDQLKIWEEQIRRGRSTKDKYTTIDKWTHDRFVEARQSNQQVTTRNLQQWALAAASQFPDLEFKASEAWVKIFKRKHRIRQRKITKFVPERETATMEETHAAAEKFRLRTRALISNYDKDFVLNTDQTGCQYQSTYNRTLAEQGSKVVLVKRKDMCVNKVTHSYTAQYVMTLFGKLLPTVFICLQGANGNFGPRVQKSVDEHAKIYTNVAITSSKSGKLTTALYKDFLIDVMMPYVKEEKFLFLIDSWGGQTNPVLYDEIFTDDKGIPTCTMKVISSKCTPLVQPCDVYFYRQVKNFIKRLQNCAYIIE